MGKKLVISILSAALVVVAIVGIVVCAVVRNDKADATHSPTRPIVISTNSIDSLCSATDFPDKCKRTLNSVSSSNSSDVIRTSIKAVVNEVTSVFDKSDDFGKSVTVDDMNKLAINDCKEMLEHAVNELKAALQVANGADALKKQSEDLRIWLSAVASYQETCIDGLTMPELQKQIKEGLTNATQLNANALSLVTLLAATAADLPNALKGISVNRRLMSTDIFPSWMSAGDRKLLAKKGGNNDGVSGNAVRMQPNVVVVAQDGSGKYKTINEAVAAIPKKNAARFVIYVKAGIYKETVTVKEPNVYMYGDGPRRTIVTGDKHFPVPTFQTATFAAVGTGFLCKGMGFRNTAGPTAGQAVALRVQADKAAFINCRIDGYQDTLYTHAHRQFYHNCIISGTIDFIFGDAAVIIQKSLIIVRKGKPSGANMVTAHGRTLKDEPTGLVIQNCRIVPEQSFFEERIKFPNYLGRPWKPYARTIVMESVIGDLIRPEGWAEWQGSPQHCNTLTYGEYGNSGPGAVTTNRVKWSGYKKDIGRQEALTYTVGPFVLKGENWLQQAGVPFNDGLTH